MVGYASNSKGYKLWDADRGKRIISRKVRFDETFSTPKTEGYEVPGSSDSKNESKENSEIEISS